MNSHTITSTYSSLTVAKRFKDTLCEIKMFHMASAVGFKVQGVGSGVSSLVLGFRISELGFRISGFGFGVWGFGFLVSSFGFRVSGFELRVSGVGFQVSSFGFRVSGFELTSAAFSGVAPSMSSSSADSDPHSSHRMYLLISFRKSTPPQKCQHIVDY